MDANTIRNAQKELSNPDSVYYLGGPSMLEVMGKYLNGNTNYNNGFNTNYFGANKRTYLAPPSVDIVQLHNKAKAENQTKKGIVLGLLGGLGAAAGFMLLKGKLSFLSKIPFLGKFFK